MLSTIGISLGLAIHWHCTGVGGTSRYTKYIDVSYFLLYVLPESVLAVAGNPNEDVFQIASGGVDCSIKFWSLASVE